MLCPFHQWREVVPQEKCWKCVSSVMLDHTQACTSLKLHRVWMDSVTAPTLQSWPHTIRFSLVWLFATACEGIIIMLMTKHHKMLCTSGCRRKRTTYPWLLFRGGRRMLLEMKTILKKNYPFSNIVVKLCEICTHVTLEMAWNKKEIGVVTFWLIYILGYVWHCRMVLWKCHESY
jgi:hypothetical protein